MSSHHERRREEARQNQRQAKWDRIKNLVWKALIALLVVLLSYSASQFLMTKQLAPDKLQFLIRMPDAGQDVLALRQKVTADHTSLQFFGTVEYVAQSPGPLTSAARAAQGLKADLTCQVVADNTFDMMMFTNGIEENVTLAHGKVVPTPPLSLTTPPNIIINSSHGWVFESVESIVATTARQDELLVEERSVAKLFDAHGITLQTQSVILGILVTASGLAVCGLITPAVDDADNQVRSFLSNVPVIAWVRP